jgi:hypothetical protein
MKRCFSRWILLSLLLSSLGWASSGNDCWAQNTYDITPKAEVKMTFYMKEWQGKPSLHLELRVKNLSDRPERFKAYFDLVDGPSVVAYIPIEGNPPVVQPKAEFTGTYPLYYGSFPKGFDFKIEVVPHE